MASETIADIVADMRGLAADIEAGNAVVGQTVWRNYADRIEAATRENRFHYRTYEEAVCDFINQVHGIVKFDANDEFARWLFNKKVEVAK